MKYEKLDYEEIGEEIGKLVKQKNTAYGDSVEITAQILKIYLEQYRNDDETYTIPGDLIKHLLIQVRIMDKQSRIFSNPSLDLMGETPYKDICGYSLLELYKNQEEFYD